MQILSFASHIQLVRYLADPKTSFGCHMVPVLFAEYTLLVALHGRVEMSSAYGNRVSAFTAVLSLR